MMKISGHRNFESFQKYIKLDEILAGDSLKKLPMFQDETANESTTKPKPIDEDSLVSPTLQQLEQISIDLQETAN
ncbi:MAG: hypothetical protein LLG13_15085 [Bacteroidales bacterium]|nr:hypothetical protein [Bacteroidales bacterium]